MKLPIRRNPKLDEKEVKFEQQQKLFEQHVKYSNFLTARRKFALAYFERITSEGEQSALQR